MGYCIIRNTGIKQQSVSHFIRCSIHDIIFRKRRHPYLKTCHNHKITPFLVIAGIDERLTLHDFRIVTGPSRTNLIFDVVTPYDFDYSDAGLCELINRRLKEHDKGLCAVIEVDKQML